MRRGERLRGAVRRARARLRQAARLPFGRKRRAAVASGKRTVAFWESKLGTFRKNKRIEKLSSSLYGGSRTVTNEVIGIVGGRASITSRKRWEKFGNPDSDHYMGNLSADAVDFGIGNAYSLAREVAQRLGGQWDGDYDSFYVTRGGRTYRVQIIAGTHGTGPHLHVGVRRA